ncbi:hypothetical protein M0R19_05860 [Candidatus Pacearchaeota archaeon]|jgi:hypothetical protein|nr:hypothetical protein [Candidatus Pacearchaeota archaeon]
MIKDWWDEFVFCKRLTIEYGYNLNSCEIIPRLNFMYAELDKEISFICGWLFFECILTYYKGELID